MVLELATTIGALTMFGIADPNTYRTKMWQVGSNNDFNSSPNEILYAYANHRPIPKTPFVWSQTLTSFNTAIAVLTMFIQLLKTVLFVMHVWYPLVNLVTSLAIMALWIVSAYGQAGPDHMDPSRPSNVAWYVRKSCSYAAKDHYTHYCRLAKGSFAVTVLMLAIFLFNVILSIHSMVPNANTRALDQMDFDEFQENNGRHSTTFSSMEKGHEMQEAVMTRPAIPEPYTPRTTAFHTLNGSTGSAGSGPDRPLPFRSMTGDDARRHPPGAPKLTLTTG